MANPCNRSFWLIIARNFSTISWKSYGAFRARIHRHLSRVRTVRLHSNWPIIAAHFRHACSSETTNWSLCSRLHDEATRFTLDNGISHMFRVRAQCDEQSTAHQRVVSHVSGHHLHVNTNICSLFAFPKSRSSIMRSDLNWPKLHGSLLFGHFEIALF